MYIEEATSSHAACSSHVCTEDIQELELTSEKCTGTEPVITVDKAVGKYTTTKSVCTQYNPLYVLNTLEKNWNLQKLFKSKMAYIKKKNRKSG